MNIFVTGASGFLGKFLVPYLKERGHTVTGVSSKECNLFDQGSLDVYDTRFDQIYHLAAWTQAGDFCLKHPGEQWINNQKINTNVLSWWHTKQPQAKMIAIGTSCSYAPSLPLVEENYLVGEPIESLYTYAMTKRMLLCGLQALHRQFGLQYLYVIPSTLYGKEYHTDGRQMHFIFDLIRKILRGKFFHEPVILWGNGEQKRELIHVNDFVRMLYELSLKEQNTLFNLGSGQEYSIKEFAQIICRHAGYPFEEIQFDLTKYVGAKSKVLSIERLKNGYPSFASKPLEEGISEVVEWFNASKSYVTHN